MRLLPLLLPLLLLPIAAADVPREERQRYVTGPGTHAFSTCPGNLLEYHVSAACFGLDGTESRAHIQVDDLVYEPIYASYVFVHEDGQTILDGGPFCDGIDIAVPPGAGVLGVFIHNGAVAAYVSLFQPLCGQSPLLLATTGEVIVQYT